MTIEGKELLVRDVRMGKSGELIVVGIPNNGMTIQIGDTFVSRYESCQTAEDIVNDIPRPAPYNVEKISLTVVSINSMRQEISELPHGTTGALHLTGGGMEIVTRNCFLMT